LELARDGGLLGVWGANGQPSVGAQRLTEGGYRLSGAKIFCSGLGLVRCALVSATLEERTALFAVSVDDLSRMDETQWDVSGMRATRSGGYDFEGVVLPADALVGPLDSYFREPHFLGGMYRFCAVQVGGLEALLDAMIDACRRRGQAGNPLVQYRVGAVAAAATTAAGATAELARSIFDARPPHDIARKAVLTREGVERCIVEALKTVERGLGTEAHRERTRLSMLRRDLSFYIRQAAVDERLTAVGRALLG
jgi:alkylation response protein AidB-like acyl-CoA dehydrogenase